MGPIEEANPKAAEYWVSRGSQAEIVIVDHVDFKGVRYHRLGRLKSSVRDMGAFKRSYVKMDPVPSYLRTNYA